MLTSIAFFLIALAGADWQCEQDDRGLWHCLAPVAESIPAAPPAEPPAAEIIEPLVVETAVAEPPAAEPRAAEAAATENYVLQVGAFRNQDIAKAGARKIDSDTLTIVPTWRGNETWYILILGAYADRRQAVAAGKAYQQEFEGADYWVRRTSELRAVLPPSEVAFPIRRGRLPE